MHRDVFFLAYHLHWQPSEILALNPEDRRGYVRMLACQIDEENRELGRLMEGMGTR